MSNSDLVAAETPLLDDTVNACLDFKGRPARRYSSGGWRSASFVIAVEIAERFTYYGIYSNLITFLTGPLGQPTASAASQVNAWAGASSLLPLLGAFVADSFLGRYRTIITSALIYVLGLGLLTLLTTLPSVDSSSNTSSLQFHVILFFFALYLIAFAQGGIKPCLEAFGADQFDAQHPEESKAKSSFFNWLGFGMASGILVTILVLNYIQENLSWVLGFGIPGIVMTAGLLVFVLGTMTYRFSVKRDGVSPFVKIGRAFALAFRNRETPLPTESSKLREVEESKAFLRLVPIWSASLIYAVVLAQSSTLFTKQGATMDRSITTGLKIPAATLQCFISISILLFIPIYDRIFVPLARSVTGKPAGITMLQRIGIGISLTAISMVVAALVETKRLKTAREHGLIDKPNVTVPMSVWWLIPQYSLYGLSDVFAYVGLQEFFYDQMPSELRSIGIAIYLSIIGVGNFLSSFLIYVIVKVTGDGHGGDGWFSDNLNKAHLDYFYWLLAGLSAVGLLLYICSTKYYIYTARGK